MVRETSYEELLKYDISGAIQFKAEENSIPFDNDPTRVSHHPLLLDYGWVYNHAETILDSKRFGYQASQGVEEYYFFFRVITEKYNFLEDYNQAIYHKEFESSLQMKWELYACKLVEFFAYAFDERLEKLLEKEDFLSYFLNHPLLFTKEVLEDFSFVGMSKLLEFEEVSRRYIDGDGWSLVQLIRKYPKIEIPSKVMLDDRVIHAVSDTFNLGEFYLSLNYIEEQISPQPYLDCHRDYCDKEVSLVQDGILPAFQKDYLEAEDKLNYCNDFYGVPSYLKEILHRIYKRKGLENLPKKEVYQELSKYVIFMMFISRNYQTSLYNFLIDIEMLYTFAKEKGRTLKGEKIYEFLLSFESMSVFEVLAFYDKVKDLPLMDMLYDDWEHQRKSLIEEINQKSIHLSQLDMTFRENESYYDITNLDNPILVTNTGVNIYDIKKVYQMIQRIKNGKIGFFCLSLQDGNHQAFYERNNKGKTVKLVYENLDSKRVGIVYHSDAYSQGINRVEFGNFKYIRRLYTLDDLMMETDQYNEITYLVDGKAFIPCGVLCENEITEEEKGIAAELGVPIYFRLTDNLSIPPEKVKTFVKGYETIPSKKSLFF